MVMKVTLSSVYHRTCPQEHWNLFFSIFSAKDLCDYKEQAFICMKKWILNHFAARFKGNDSRIVQIPTSIGGDPLTVYDGIPS